MHVNVQHLPQNCTQLEVFNSSKKAEEMMNYSNYLENHSQYL